MCALMYKVANSYGEGSKHEGMKFFPALINSDTEVSRHGSIDY